jgi:hypothetical protein
MLFSAGTIPYDHLITMHQHPDFATVIAPAIREARELISTPEGWARVIDILSIPKATVQALLGEIEELRLELKEDK